MDSGVLKLENCRGATEGDASEDMVTSLVLHLPLYGSESRVYALSDQDRKQAVIVLPGLSNEEIINVTGTTDSPVRPVSGVKVQDSYSFDHLTCSFVGRNYYSFRARTNMRTATVSGEPCGSATNDRRARTPSPDNFADQPSDDEKMTPVIDKTHLDTNQ